MTSNQNDNGSSPLEGPFASLNLNNTHNQPQSASARFEKFFSTAPSPAPAQDYGLHPNHAPHPNQSGSPGPYGSLGAGAAPKYLAANGFPSAGGSFRTKSVGRAGLPSQWAASGAGDPSLSPAAAAMPLAPHSPAYYAGGSQLPGSGFLQHHPSGGLSEGASDPLAADDDDVIPTAIVVKNIPFSVKREQLLQIIQDLSIPMPYAFNYHYDQGIFRGLAFANFRSPEEADAVVAALNGFDVSGRKLRVEYKKVLQAGEKERIEKEKAIKRMRSMQMEKERLRRETSNADFGGNGVYGGAGLPPLPPMPHYYASNASSIPPLPSFSGPEPQTSSGVYGSTYSVPSTTPGTSATSTTSHTADTSAGSMFNGNSDTLSPPGALTADALSALGSSASGPSAPSERSGVNKKEELDMNDAQTLEIYSRVLLFKDDRMRDELAFSRNLAPMERRTVHLVAQKLGLFHYSVGEADERHVIVTKHEVPTTAGGGRPLRSQASTIGRSHRNDTGGFLSAGTVGRAGLRGKKSAPDMKRMRDYEGGGSRHSNSPFDPAPPLPVPSSMRGGNELSVPSNGLASLARRSNGNLREGYSATIGSGAAIGRRSQPGGGAAGLQSLFHSPFDVPPVPTLGTGTTDGRSTSPSGGAIRQPRGPPTMEASDVRNFANRVPKSSSPAAAEASESGNHQDPTTRNDLNEGHHMQHQSQSHEPLEI